MAKKNDKNSNDFDIKLGKKSVGNNMPTKIDFEKSGLGNNNKPINRPIIIEICAFFSLIPFLKKVKNTVTTAAQQNKSANKNR